LTAPSPNPGNPARAALAARLTQLRAAAGLSGNALARRLGKHQSRVWKIENGSLLPTEEDIRAWTRETGNEQEEGSLMAALAEARGEQAFSVVLRRKGGGAAFEEQVQRTEQEATRIGEFQVAVIPGLLQTADYMRALLSVPSGLRTWDPDGIEAKVSGRLRRQEILHDPSRRVQVVLGEGALRTLVVPAPVLAGQLRKLLSVMRLPSLELGVIGFGQRMPVYPLGFRVYDDQLAVIESTVDEHGYAADTKGEQLAALVEAFHELRQAASHGDDAEALIRRALEDLEGLP
jgi:transcriptional regulator with XRE-family HTH domain